MAENPNNKPSPIQWFKDDVREWLPAPPYILIVVALFLVIGTWVPLALVFNARFTTSTQPRPHLFLDMDNQAKVQAQDASPIFADGYGMRKPVAGTVAFGDSYEGGRVVQDAMALQADDHLFRGFKLVTNAEGESVAEYFDGMPQGLTVDTDFVLRGKEMFNTHCATCHGYDGGGQGPVHLRATEIMNSNLPSHGTSWVAPTNLHDQAIVDHPDGHIYNTIRNGIRNMKGYGSQIDVKDRWAVVAYVRALQLSRNAPANTVSADDRQASLAD